MVGECCVRSHCIPDYQKELDDLSKRARETQEYLNELESRILELQNRLDNDDFSSIDTTFAECDEEQSGTQFRLYEAVQSILKRF